MEIVSLQESIYINKKNSSYSVELIIETGATSEEDPTQNMVTKLHCVRVKTGFRIFKHIKLRM